MNNLDWVPLLVPEMPTLADISPFIKEIDAAKIYSNNGPLVKRLESIFANAFSVDKKFVTTVANATLGIELVLNSLNLKKGAKILIPAMTFVATATAVVRAGYEPVFGDVDKKDWILTPSIAEDIVKRCSIDAVITVASFGKPHKMAAWKNFQNIFGIPVIIDAAAAYGGQWLEEGWGTFVFSLHATKSLSAGEGGLVVSNDEKVIENIRCLSNFGINLGISKKDSFGSLLDIGTNAKMSEYHAAVALAALKRWGEKSYNRRQLYEEYVREINIVSASNVGFQGESSTIPSVAPMQFCMTLPSRSMRDDFETICIKRKIMTRRWYQPLVAKMDIFQDSRLGGQIDNSIDLSERMIGIPFFPSISNEQKICVFDAVAEVFSL